MTALVKQPSRFPTRKILAVILSGMILGILQSALRILWPDHPFAPYMDDFDVWLQGFIMVVAGYLTKEKRNEVGSESVSGSLPQSPVNDDSQLSFDPLWDAKEETGQGGSGDTGSPTRREETGESS